MSQNVKLVKEVVKHLVQSVLLICLVIVTVEASSEAQKTWECPPCPSGATLLYQTSFKCGYLVKERVVINIERSVFFDRYGIDSDAEDLQLDDASIPRLPELLNVSSVVQRHFPPPQGSYADALLSLNVTVHDRLKLYDVPLTAPPLRDDHFQGLETLQWILMTSSGSVLPAGIFSPLTALKEVALYHTVLKEDVLMTLPTSLESLTLSNCSIASLPAGAMSRLRALKRLLLVNQPLESPPALDKASPSLTTVEIINSPLKRMPPLHRIRNATIRNSVLEDMHLPGGCGSLLSLTVKDAAVTSLPAAWLTKTGGQTECCALRTLVLMSLERLASVHARALHGACNLIELKISWCKQLETLPVGLMRPLTNLRKLVLTSNNLKTLPGGLLSPLTSMQWLDLSSNALKAATLADALTGTLPALTTLEAGANWLLDLCPVDTDTAHAPNDTWTHLPSLLSLQSLKKLNLPNAGISRVCPQWRRLRNLRRLDLHTNNISEITLQDMQWERAANDTVVVDVRNNPISRVTLSESEYRQLSRSAPGHARAHPVTLLSNAAVRCDCAAYWLARAVREGCLPARVVSVTCQNDKRTSLERLDSIDLQTMVCKRSECSEGCSCNWWPSEDTMVVYCATNDSTWPSLQAVRAQRIELNLSNSNMSRLPLTSLPERVRRVDVSNNALSDVTMLLARDDVTLRLQRNALHCDCTQLRELYRRRHQIEDFDQVTCRDGSLLTSRAPPALCGGEVAGTVGLSVGLLLLVVGAVLAARRVVAAREKMKHRKLLAEAPYMYDGFLVFAHQDGWFAERVMSALESERGLRLCVHVRDWEPGAWLPACIARSVACSRRTLVLVSRQCARSQWACIELQQAAARAAAGSSLGPVLVLLGPIPRAMRAHVRRHHSLRATDHRLWDKLHRLLAPGNVTAPPIRHVNYTGACQAEETGANRSGTFQAEETGANRSGTFQAEETGANRSGTFQAEETGANKSGTLQAEETGANRSGTIQAQEPGGNRSGTFQAHRTGSNRSRTYQAQETGSNRSGRNSPSAGDRC